MNLHRLALGLCAITLGAAPACAGALPSDVRPNHWAAHAVERTLKAGILRLQPDGKFHGDAKVTRTEAVVALAALGQKFIAGTWKSAGKSQPVPDSVASIWEKTDWKSEPVRRYAFAAIVARFADYFANGFKRPATGAKVGQSEALPPVTVSTPPGSPGYDALKYLAGFKMIRPDSPLMKPDGAPLTGTELSRALTELATGATDRLTELVPDDAGPVGSDPPKRK